MIILSITDEQFTLIRLGLAALESANHTSKEEAIAAMLRGEGGEAQALINSLMTQYQQQAEFILETSDGQVINVQTDTEAEDDYQVQLGKYRANPL